MIASDAPWPTKFVVPPDKLVAYLLNPEHPKGASKCAYLTSYGFTRDQPHELETALHWHAQSCHLVAATPIASGGFKFVFDGPMPTPNGKSAYMLAVWQMDETTGKGVRFITARPSR